MLFAMTAEQHVIGMLLFFMLGVWAIRTLLGDIDKDGVVKERARTGLVNLISRWLK